MNNPLTQLLGLVSALKPADTGISLTLEGLKAMYPPFAGQEKPGKDGKVKRGATKKNHRHVMNPVWLPGSPRISPAAYRRQHLGKKKNAKR